MIFVDRDGIEDPILSIPALKEMAHEEYTRLSVEMSGGGTGQRRLQFAAYQDPRVRMALHGLFHNKCAYCETLLAASDQGDVSHYRPKSSVLESPKHNGYWWLAASWDNLLLACANCNRENRNQVGALAGKGSRFPIEDGSDRQFRPSEAVTERPLLLDPTKKEDDPINHLVFGDDGIVYSSSLRGNTTIEVLKLNRPRLIAARFEIWLYVRSLFEKFMHALADEIAIGQRQENLIIEMRQCVRAEAPYAAIARQYLRSYLYALPIDIGAIVFGDDIHANLDILSSSTVSLLSGPDDYVADYEILYDSAFETMSYRQNSTQYSLDEIDPSQEDLPSQQRLVQRIAVRDLRAIETLDLSLLESGQRWLMLIGENGVGKSTILQAIALVLGGPKMAARLIGDERLVPANMIRQPASAALVQVWLTGFVDPHELRISQDELVFTAPHGETVKINAADGSLSVHEWPRHVFVLGYGATRLSSSNPDHKPYWDRFARIGNLFSPLITVQNATQWLLNCTNESFAAAGQTLQDIFDLDVKHILSRDVDTNLVCLVRSDLPVPLDQLSSGYSTVIALVVDIIDALTEWREQNFQDGQAIIMLDEIDAHLHPRWQMRLVNRLKKTFPEVQFITTTHQPLCLRGLADHETVVLLDDPSGGVVAMQKSPLPDLMSIDEMLTSDLFGLHTTISATIERAYERYYDLLALGEGADPDELQKQIAQLERFDQFGHTTREKIYRKVIDRQLANVEKNAPVSIDQITDEVCAELSGLWDEVKRDEPESPPRK